MTLGPLMVDIEGTALSAEDREILAHPLVGGVILFTRNFIDSRQLAGLLESIHQLRSPRLLVAVDHEGGRVQRFRKDFTVLPPARAYGKHYATQAKECLQQAEQAGWLMAAECLAVGIDISFAPVLDLDHGVSSIIGDRAFHRNPDAVGALAGAFAHGMKRAGMAATGKHFPGHGGIAEDSHLELPVDSRPLVDLQLRDMKPFAHLIRNNIAAMMMAHVVYPDVDDKPASFSRRWIEIELRRNMNFHGAVFCDDLTMEGASVIGSFADRAQVALEAGCDMLPVCNHRAAVIEIIDNIKEHIDPAGQIRLVRLHGRANFNLAELQARKEWQDTVALLADLARGEDQQLELG